MSTDTHTGHNDMTQYAGEHDEHHPSDGRYIQIALILGAITAIEVALSYIDVGKLFVPALVICMIAKFGIVAGYFMHLKFDNTLLTRVFVAGLLLAIGVYIAFLTSLEIFS
jgi:cytochrome c oxidase subunit 4